MGTRSDAYVEVCWTSTSYPGRNWREDQSSRRENMCRGRKAWKREGLREWERQEVSRPQARCLKVSWIVGFVTVPELPATAEEGLLHRPGF